MRSVDGILVETVTANPADCPGTVWGTGTVRPRKSVDVVPQVSGRVISVSPRFVQGGIFTKGEELFRIEPVDYELALEQARGELARAELNLEIEKTRGGIALKEWQNLEEKPAGKGPPLVLRKPQLRQAQAALAAARAAVRQAKINLERTRIRAPFNAVVKAENVDEGQYVKQGIKVATLTGTDIAEIIVPVSLEDLEWIKVPGIGGSSHASSAVVSVNSRNRRYEWKGSVVRLLGDVDPKSRMSRVVVDVHDPFMCPDTGRNCNIRLVDGLFVDVNFVCGMLHNVYVIKREALRDGDTVWIMDHAGRLRIRKVHVAHYQKDMAIIDTGLEPGERVVLTFIPGAADGMLLRTASGGGSR
jgi:RND family efflux transporter MFP subunit